MPAPSLNLSFSRPAVSPAEAAPIARATDLSGPAAAVVVARGYDTPARARELLEPTNALSHDPFRMKGMKAIAERVRTAVANKEPILIFGDYDADGIPGTALLANFLRASRAVVDTYIPPRESGYGLSMEQAKIILERFRPALVITIDCGSSDHEAIRWLKSKGVDVAVTDHHLTLKGAPPTPYFINPSRSDGETYPFRYLCGCGVAYKLVQALSTRPHEPVLYDLVALSTIGDLVSLTGENRYYVTAALRQLHAKASGNVGLRAIVETVGGSVSIATIDAVDVGWKIAPRINAVGRMGADPNMVVELLTTSSHSRAMEIAKETHRLNSARQTLTERLFEEAIERIGPSPRDPLVVAYLPDAGVGVAGLVAAKIVELYGRPTLVVNGEGRGSGRAPDGVPLMPIMEQLRAMGLFGVERRLASGKSVTADFGGHAQACGFHHVDVDDLLRAASRVRGGPGPGGTFPVPVDAEIDLSVIDERLVRDIAAVGPYGIGHAEPAFLVRDLRVLEQVVSSTGRQLRLVIADAAGAEMPGIWFNAGEIAGRLPARVDVVASVSYFAGRVQLRLRAARAAKR
jgi:single-stranded-DNA-specific exonuclease